MKAQVIPAHHEIEGTSDPFQSETWLTVDDIVAMGRSRRKVLVNISSGKWPSRISDRRLANRKRARVVTLESLPEDLQRRWLASQHAAQPTTEVEEIDSPKEQDLDALKAEHRLNDALKRFSIEERAAFLDEARRLAGIVERYIALPAKRELVTSVDLKPTGETFEFTTGKQTYEFTPAVFALCEEAKCTNEIILKFYKSRRHAVRDGATLSCARVPRPKTLDDWSRSYRKEGLLTFLPTPPQSLSAKDKRRARISKPAAEWINNNWRSKPHARALYQDLEKQAKKHGWIIPSETWVYRKWKNLPKIVTTALRSKKAYVDKFAPYYPRDYSDLEALQILCGDHSVRDVTVRLPDGTLDRPWLTLWQCMRTGLIWGWHLDLTPSSRTIGLAYANGVKTFGAQPPARPDDGFFSYLYTDQGRDYKSRNIKGQVLTFKRAAAVEGGLGFLCDHRQVIYDERVVGLIADLGHKHLEARGWNAREKPIERTHRDLSGWEEKYFDAEYCGRDAKNKPDAWKDAWERHERLRKKVVRTGSTSLLDESPFITFDDYRDALEGRFAEYNNATHERTTLGGAKVIPIEEYKRLYLARYGGPIAISEDSLALLLMKAERRMVRKNGVSLFQQGFSYLHPDLGIYKDQYVEVRYTDADYSHVWIIPPPTPDIPNPDIIRADLVTRGGILNPNKQTLAMISHQRKHEEKTIRDHSFLTQSIIRGESVEDRVAAQLEPEVEEQAQVALAVGAEATGSGFAPPPARVHLVGRLDRKRVGQTAIRPVTVDQVKDTPVDDSIFEEERSGSVVKMWEEEE